MHQSVTGSWSLGGWTHSDAVQFPVGCNVKWLAVILRLNPPAQPMCARVLAGFLCTHFYDNLCTVLEEYMWVEISFTNLGVCEEE